MITLIPYKQICTITGRYGDGWNPTSDQPADIVRDVARDLRAGAGAIDARADAVSDLDAWSYRARLLAEAAELDALSDRIEAAA